MPKASYIQTAYNRGELTPLVGGQITLEQRQDGLGTCQNLVLLKQGPITRRPPSYFVAEVKNSSKYTRLVNFEFSTVQAYQLEFGENYVRFYRDYGIITNASQTITGITKANPAVVTYSGADTYANGDHVYLTVTGMTELNNRRFTVANVNAGANTFELAGINSTAYTTFTAGSVAEVYEVTTTYTEAQISELSFIQSADVLYIAHEAHPIRALLRAGHNSWSLVEIELIDGPFQPENQKSDGSFATALTVTPSAVSGVGITLTASAALFAATDVGRLVRLKHASTWGYAVITAFTSSTVVTATVKQNYGATTATTSWRLGSYSATTGYPSTIGFIQDRFVAAAPTSFPQQISFGQTGQYTSTSITFKPTAVDGTVADDNGFNRSIPSGSVNKIQWISEDARGLLVGTTANEWVITASQIAGSLKPDDAFQRKVSSIGSVQIAPVQINSVTIFVQNKGRNVHQVAYSLSNDSLESTDLTVLSEHITRTGIVSATYQQEPLNVVWFALSDGTLVGMTFLPEQKVVGFHKHFMGGTNAKVISVSSIPSPTNSQDDLWAIVERTIAGGTKKYVEYFKPYYEDTQLLADSAHVDSASVYSGTATSTVTGLWHLEGQTVKVMADGSSHPDVTVTNGTITLSAAYSKVIAGLGYAWKAVTLPIEAGAADGTAQGKIKRINNVTVRLLNTLGLRYGKGDDTYADLQEDNFDYGLQMGVATPLYSGDRFYLVNDDYNTQGTLQFSHDGIFPVTLLAHMPQLNTSDRG